MLYDAHAHLGTPEEQELRQRESIHTLLCATNPESVAAVKAAALEHTVFTPTYGLHPWYADAYDAKEMLRHLDEGGIVGEIGMDSVWCDVPLAVQRHAFLNQLDFAEKNKRAVILHTKGQEKAISEIMRDYSMPVLVHWYSSEDHLERYIERDCFFTVGPDVALNPAVQALVKAVPIDRLLVESDGLSAVCWAFGEDLPAESLPTALKNSISYIAKTKNISYSEAEKAVSKNFARFA